MTHLCVNLVPKFQEPHQVGNIEKNFDSLIMRCFCQNLVRSWWDERHESMRHSLLES